MITSGKKLLIRLIDSISSNKKLSTYLIFLAVAFSFWFLNNMSREHETTLILPIHYIDFPADKLVLEKPEQELTVCVKAAGFPLLYYNLFGRHNLQLSIDDAYWRKKNKQSVAFWMPNNNRRKIKNVLSSSMNLLSVSPDTLQLIFGKKARKTVPIQVCIDITFKEEFRLTKPIISVPEEVMIYGAQEQLDSIEYIASNLLQFTDVTNDKTTELQLQKIEGISFQTDKVFVTIDVEQFTEKRLSAVIHADHVPKGYAIKFLPATVDVTLTASIDNYKLLTQDFVRLFVDCSTILDSKYTYLDVQMKDIQFAQMKRIYPSRVEYILIKE